jgi:hypothetical protein
MVLEVRVDRFRVGALLLLAVSGCERSSSSSELVFESAIREREWSLPPSSASPDATCFDVGHHTACFAATGAQVAARRLPALAGPSTLGFRCWERAGKRTCVDRLAAAGPFSCSTSELGKTRCQQRAPRVPRGGIWDCGDDSGAVVCLGQEAPPIVDGAWICGIRGGAGNAERVCVDLSPDYPDGVAEGWDCGFEDDPHAVGGRARTCTRTEGTHLLGSACDAKHPCVDGALCVSGVCLPQAPRASCIANQDCAGGPCRFGGCALRRGHP